MATDECPWCGKYIDIDDMAARHGTFYEHFGANDEANIEPECPWCDKPLRMSVRRDISVSYEIIRMAKDEEAPDA